MNFDSDWRSRDGTSPIQWKNTQHYLQPPYSTFKSQGNLHTDLEHSDPSYAAEGDSSNQSRLAYCSSPERLGYFNYFPESQLSNEMNRNLRYPSYPRQPMRYNDASPYSSCRQFHNDLRLNAELNAKKYRPQMSQLMNMRHDPYMGNNYTTKTNQAPLNVKKKKKQTTESKLKRIKAADSSEKSSANYTYEELVINFKNPLHNKNETSSFLTATQTSGYDTTRADPFLNVFNGQYFLENNDEICGAHKDDFSNIHSLGNRINITSKAVGFHKTLSTDGNHKKTIKEENCTNKDSEVSDRAHMNMKTDIDGRISEFLNETDAPVEEIPLNVTTENSNFQIRDSVYTEEGFENVIFQPIFEGKDENGEDVIVLLVSPGIHQGMPQDNSNMVLNTELISSEESKELIPLNEAQLNTLPELQTEEVPCSGNSQQNVVTETLNESYKKSGLQIEGTDIFFSNINDFVSEEADVAIVNKSSNIKRTKKQESHHNTPLKKKLNQRKVSDNLLQTNDSKSSEFDDKLEVCARASLITNRKKLKTSYKTSKFKRRSSYRSKSTMLFKSFKNLFISEIVNLFKVRDASISRNETWEMMKNQIGCSVLQSMFTTIQILAKSEVQKSRYTVSKKK